MVHGETESRLRVSNSSVLTRLNRVARDRFTLSAINPSGIVRAAYLTAGTLVQVAISTFLGDLFMYRKTARVTGVKSWLGSLGFANRRTRNPRLGPSGLFLPTDPLVVSSSNDFPLVTLVESEVSLSSSAGF